MQSQWAKGTRVLRARVRVSGNPLGGKGEEKMAQGERKGKGQGPLEWGVLLLWGVGPTPPAGACRKMSSWRTSVAKEVRRARATRTAWNNKCRRGRKETAIWEASKRSPLVRGGFRGLSKLSW